eukprot:scaffold473_cov156-Amphora_coffeaeformis.AAC.2
MSQAGGEKETIDYPLRRIPLLHNSSPPVRFLTLDTNKGEVVQVRYHSYKSGYVSSTNNDEGIVTVSS